VTWVCSLLAPSPSSIMSNDADVPNPFKLFLGGLSFESTEDSINAYFTEKFGAGKVADTQVVRDRLTNQSRGFGFITFTDDEATKMAQQSEHVIDGRSVMARKATPKSETPPPAHLQGGAYGAVVGGTNAGAPISDVTALPDYNPMKMFVGGVSHAVDEEQFKAYFAQYGEVQEAWLMYDPQTQRPRGFGFIVYSSSVGLDTCLGISNHEIAGKMVETKRATPRSANPPPNRLAPGKGAMGGRGGGGRGGGGYGGGYGMMPPMMGGYGYGGGMMPGMNMAGGYGMGAMGAMGGYGAGGGYGPQGGYGAAAEGAYSAAGAGGAGGYGAAAYGGGYGAGYCCGEGGGAAACGGAAYGASAGAGAGAGAAGYGPSRGNAGGREQRSYTPY